MTGERALIAVISILWISAAFMAIPAVFLFGNAIVTNEDNPDLLLELLRGLVPALWFAGPAIFLPRGSRIARGFAIFASLIGLAAALVFTIGLTASGAPELGLLGAPFVLVFLFSTGALLFDRDLRVALDQRLEKWEAAERAKMKELEDAMNESSEK